MNDNAQQSLELPAPLLRGWAHLISFPVWMVGGLAMVALTNVHPSGRILLAIYVVGTGAMFGVSALFVFPQLANGLGALGFSLLAAGGALYTIGAVTLATRWPDPWPRVFGFHEVFHAFTVVAAALVFVAVGFAVVPQL